MLSHSVNNLKNNVSTFQINVPLGFIYWLQEYSDLRGLKGTNILLYPEKLEKLLKEYNKKYPNGLTGWR